MYSLVWEGKDVEGISVLKNYQEKVKKWRS